MAEIGWQEERTTNFIKNSLPLEPIKLGFKGKKVGLLYKVGEGKESILLRADIDALKIDGGIKHICGHSSHASALIAAFIDKYKLIKEHKNKTVYFLFQPAEETYPSGAKAFLDECSSLFPEIKYSFAAHVRPKLPLGVLGLPHIVVGRGDYMEITIHGKMVHVKNTPDGIDALEAASYIVLFVKKLQRKYVKHLRINIGVASAGLQPNAVPDYAILKGDIRMKDDKYQNIVKKLMSKKIKELEKELGVKIDFKYFDGYPILVNDKNLLNKIISFIAGNTNLKPLLEDNLFTFGSEDFSFIANKIPSLYALVGTGDLNDIHEINCTISDEGTKNIYTYFVNVIDWWLKEK